MSETRDSLTATTTFDHNDPTQPATEIYAKYAELVSGCPVAHVDRHGGYLLVSGYECARDVATDADTFRSGDGVFLPDAGMPRIPALEYDGAEHATWRGLIDDLVNPNAVRNLEPLVTEVVNQQIDTFIGRGHADLAVDFAEPVPAVVIGRMVGLTREESLTNRELAGAAFAAIETPEFETKFGEFAGYGLARIAERRAHPRNDFLTMLASGEHKGIPIDDQTAIQILVALLMGGHHSTASGILGMLRYALSDNSIRDTIAQDPRALPRLLEESLRLTTPLQMFARTVAAPATIGARQVDDGTRVLLNYGAANRDPNQFPNPDNFDLSRRRNPHLAFGAGIHLCAGQHLARLEMKTALTLLLSRLPDVQLSGDITTSGLIAGALMTITSLPVRFSAT
jgi:cytochrome P450